MTKFIFCSLCDEHHAFVTAGIPYVRVSLKEGGKIRIKKNLTMNNGLSDNALGFGKTPCCLLAMGGDISIGENVGMSQSALFAYRANIAVGDHTLLGAGTKIYTSDFHSLDYSMRRNAVDDKAHVISCDVNIGSDCFIGAGTMILKGVTIGDRTIIGAGSVVTHDIPSDVIAAGNPCRIIRKLDAVNEEKQVFA